MTSSPLPVSLTSTSPAGERRRLRLIRTCGCCLIVGCTLVLVPGSILIALGTRDTPGDVTMHRPGIVLMGVALAGMAIGCLMYCCVRKYREKHIAETILMKRQSTYSVASAHSSVRSHRSDNHSPHEQRSRSHSPISRTGSYHRQTSVESHRSMTSFHQSSVESHVGSRRSLVSVRQSSVESSRRSMLSVRQSSVESSRRSLSSMKQSSVELHSPGHAVPVRQSSFDLDPASEKRKVPYRQASCDLHPGYSDGLKPTRQSLFDLHPSGRPKPIRQQSFDIQSPKKVKPSRQASMDLGHSPPPSCSRHNKTTKISVALEKPSRRSSLASLITQKISSHSDKYLKTLKVPQYYSLDLPSIELADFSDNPDRSGSPRASVTSSLLVPSTPPSDVVLQERRGSQGLLEVPTEQYLTVPSPHRRFSR